MVKFSRTDSDVKIEFGDSIVKIALHGAHVYSWTIDGEEQLFLSSNSSIDGPIPIRGGIPICFPIFGPPPDEEPFKNMKQHGFARNLRWDFLKVSEDKDWIQAEFNLDSTNPKVQEFNYPSFKCTYLVNLKKDSLSTELRVKNASEGKLKFQSLLHNYLRIPVRSRLEDVRLRSLDGSKFDDKVSGLKMVEEERLEVDFKEGEVDRVYLDVPDKIEVDLGDGNFIDLFTNNLPDLTVWNPDKRKSGLMKDMEEGGWKRFVCVEPGQTSFLELGVDETWIGKQELKKREKKN